MEFKFIDTQPEMAAAMPSSSWFRDRPTKLDLTLIDLRAMMNAVRDPRIAKDSTGYGQVAALKANPLPDLNVLWIAPTGSVTAPLVIS